MKTFWVLEQIEVGCPPPCYYAISLGRAALTRDIDIAVQFDSNKSAQRYLEDLVHLNVNKFLLSTLQPREHTTVESKES